MRTALALLLALAGCGGATVPLGPPPAACLLDHPIWSLSAAAATADGAELAGAPAEEIGRGLGCFLVLTRADLTLEARIIGAIQGRVVTIEIGWVNPPRPSDWLWIEPRAGIWPNTAGP